MSGRLEEYRGVGAAVRFDGAKCIHSRHCVLEQPAVFEANVKDPWIHPDAAPPEAAVGVAHNFPAGAGPDQVARILSQQLHESLGGSLSADRDDGPASGGAGTMRNAVATLVLVVGAGAA